jgi:hypothetical protein
MHEPIAVPPAAKLARAFGVIDALSAAIAGFALFAGTRAFTFLALVALREPVLGGAGLMLLAIVGWVRWFCRHVVIEGGAPRGPAIRGPATRRHAPDRHSGSGAQSMSTDYAARSDSSSVA